MEIQLVLFIILGIFLGAFGTLVGTGGGFILVPVLLWLYPGQKPEFITSISLAVVSVNSLSGVWAYGRMKRVDFRSGMFFAAATVPGAVLGALSTAYVPRNTFDFAIGLLLIIACVMLLSRTAANRKKSSDSPTPHTNRHYHLTRRTLIKGGGLSFLIGFFSSMLGISGGIFQVPLMVYGLGFPVHAAVATSEFILALKGLAATSVHVLSGAVFEGLRQISVLSIGVFIGAQVGAWLSNHVNAQWIMRVLALSIGSIGIRFLITGFAF